MTAVRKPARPLTARRAGSYHRFMTSKRYLLSQAAALVLCAVALVLAMQLWDADIDVPFHSWGDAVMTVVNVGGASETGWVSNFSLLGGQFGLDSNAFPQTEGASSVLIFLIARVSRGIGMTMNLFFLLGFFLATATALHVFLRRGFHPALSVAAALLYAFLPYHLLRGEYHIFLAAYYAAPLVLDLALRIAEGGGGALPTAVPSAGAGAGGSAAQGRDPARTWTAGAVLVALLAGISGAYYAFFSAFFLLFAAVVRTVRDRAAGRRAPLRPYACVGLVAAALAVDLIPFAVHLLRVGSTAGAVVRGSAEAEVYGLKLAFLLLPVQGHRIPALAELTQAYMRSGVYSNENSFAALGVVGAFGFLASLVALLFARPRTDRPDLRMLGTFQAAAFALATVGGFGSLFALLVSKEIRAYNRLSVFMAFLALLAVLLLLQRAVDRLAGRRRAAAAAAVAVAVLGLGLFDQTTPAMVPTYAANWQAYMDDAAFVQAVEAEAGAGALVFQLPFLPYPEHGPIRKMIDYDPARMALHSKTLHWSYGATKGSAEAAWMEETAALPAAEMIARLRGTGYAGIYVDRAAYEPAEAQALEASILAVAGKAPVVDGDARLAYYPIR